MKITRSLFSLLGASLLVRSASVFAHDGHIHAPGGHAPDEAVHDSAHGLASLGAGDVLTVVLIAAGLYAAWRVIRTVRKR